MVFHIFFRVMFTIHFWNYNPKTYKDSRFSRWREQLLLIAKIGIMLLIIHVYYFHVSLNKKPSRKSFTYRIICVDIVKWCTWNNVALKWFFPFLKRYDAPRRHSLQIPNVPSEPGEMWVGVCWFGTWWFTR